jgi:hypothetical protein
VNQNSFVGNPDELPIRTLGNFINYKSLYTSAFYGFIYQFIYCDGAKTFSDMCEKSLSYGHGSEVCEECPGRCVPDVLEHPDDP